MPLGYHFGALYLPSVDSEYRIRKLWQLGLATILLFVLMRAFNIYGDSYSWTVQETVALTAASFFNLTKYPPSLMFLLVTIGPSLIFLALAEKWKGGFADKLVTIGRVPMFFYIIHIYVIHLAAVVAALLTGFSFSDMVIHIWVTMQSELQGYGFSLWVVYLLWIVLVVVLYPICSWYNSYKQSNRGKWWLSYL